MPVDTTQPPNTLSLNRQLAKSLQTLHDNFHAYRPGFLMERCVHPLDEYIVHGDDDVQAAYCGAALCLLCRRTKATGERIALKGLIDTAQSTITPPPLLFFQTLTLQDALPAEVKARAGLLVKAFTKLRRKLPCHLIYAPQQACGRR